MRTFSGAAVAGRTWSPTMPRTCTGPQRPSACGGSGPATGGGLSTTTSRPTCGSVRSSSVSRPPSPGASWHGSGGRGSSWSQVPRSTGARKIPVRPAGRQRLVMVELLIKSGPLAGRRVEPGHQLTVGRGAADLVIDDPSVSRIHAVFRSAGDAIEVEDLGSRNGTKVNGEPIAAVTALRPGDSVEVGG